MRTRRQRVKDALRQANYRLCALAAFYRSGELHNGRNEIGRLRLEGWVIDAEWVTHDGIAHAHYIVRVDPERRPEQLAWQAA
ncbi:MAG: hypothetical protein NUW01_11735 [Gemmatimonadaceae bacterium]|nr:hypothetical protein [Gemmatimonadaceae bacterium]